MCSQGVDLQPCTEQAGKEPFEILLWQRSFISPLESLFSGPLNFQRNTEFSLNFIPKRNIPRVTTFIFTHTHTNKARYCEKERELKIRFKTILCPKMCSWKSKILWSLLA